MASRERAPTVTIRTATPEDAARVAELAGQLGYPSSADEMGPRLADLAESPEHAVMVAIGSEERVVGWVHVATRPVLLSEPVVEVLGLVVDEAARGRGTGKALMKAAESWARGQGVPVVMLRSNVVREAAHAFYDHLGYRVQKTVRVFRKHLES